MKKLFNKSIAMLMALSMLLGTVSAMSVFAQNNANYAKADFDNATVAEGAYEGMTFAHEISKGNKNGTPSLAKSDVPYYGTMLKFDQVASTASSDNLQFMAFTLDEGIVIGENAPENSYAEFSADVKLQNKKTGINFEIRNKEQAATAYIYRLNIRANGDLYSNNISNGVAAPSGTNAEFNNLRFRIDLKNKTVVGIYVDDVLLVDLSEAPIALNSGTYETLDVFKICIGSKDKTDTLYIDNVNVVTYTSEDGTSKVANKTALRAKLAEFAGVGLIGSAKVTFDNAVALAKNPAATQAEVDDAVAALGNMNTEGLPEIAVSETFSNGISTTYDDFTISYNNYSKEGTASVISDANPAFGNMYAFAQKKDLAKPSPVNFVMTNPIDYSEAVDGQFAEFTFDIRVDIEKGSTQQVRLLQGSTVASHMNVALDHIRIGTSYADATVCTYANNGLENGYNRNVKVIMDLKNNVVKALYVDDVRMKSDSTGEYLTDVPMGPATKIDTIEYRWGSASHGVGSNGYTFAVDNVELVSYIAKEGASPIASKKALRDKIGEIYTYAFNAEDTVKFNNALEVANNPVATAEDVTNALASLNTIKLTNTKVLAAEDFEGGADGDYADFTYTTTYNSSAAKTETILTANDANPILNKMFGLMQGEQTGDASKIKSMYPIANFALKNPVDFEGAKEGDFAEVAFDVKVSGTAATTFAFLMRDEKNQEVARMNIAKDLVRVGYGYTNEPTRVGEYDTIGLADGIEKNIKVVFDLYNKDIEAVFVDGVRVLDRTEDNNVITNVALNPNMGSQISKITFNWSDGSDRTTSTDYTFALDNLRVIKYSGETPEANKAALLRAINTRYATSDSAVLVNAKNIYKDLFATQEDVDAAVEALAGLNTYLADIVAPQKDIYTDSLIKPDFSADGITFTATSEPAGYVDSDLKVTQPTDKSVDVAVTYILTRGDKSVSKTYNITIHPRVCVEINEALFEDAEGNVIFGPVDGGKLKSVSLKNNSSNDDITFYAAVYEGGRLQSVKSVPVTDGTKTLDIQVNENSEIKYFVWENDTFMPIQPTREVTPENPTVHIIADSIYADYSSDAYKSSQPDYGIGQAMSVILAGTDINVNNKAHPGSKVPFWYESGRFDSLLSDMKQGDYLLISLCHNDQKYALINEFKTNITRVANEAKEQGVIPFFVTAIPRYTWNSNGELNYSHTRDGQNYVQAVIDVANELNAPLIDMNAHLREVYTAEGTTQTTYEHWYSLKEGENLDRTHLSEEGAMYCANWLLGEMKALEFPFVQNLADE